jgi:hypothetical protein
MRTARPTAVIVSFLVCSLSATLACAQARAAVDPRVKAEISAVDAQITDAEAENVKYAGGLVKALVESRLATLKQTRALLAQRATADDLNVAIRYTADGKPFTLPDGAAAALAGVEAELEAIKPKIAAAEAEAARYAGGLVQAMSLTTVATMRQSQAMLDQKLVSLKYGLPQFIGFASDQLRSTASFAPLAGLRVALRTTDVVAEEPVRFPDPNRAQGKDIRVRLNDGTTHRGKLVAFSASEVALDSQTVPLADVREIEKVSHAVRNATLISLLAAVPTILVLGPAFDMGNDMVFAITGAGVASGIAVGAVIGAVRKPGNVIYGAPGASASISVRPILARERKGVALATSW